MKLCVILLLVCCMIKTSGARHVHPSNEKATEDFHAEVASEEMEDPAEPSKNQAFDFGIYIGCFKDKLFSRGFTTDHKHYPNDPVQSCADRAKRLGNVFFAIQAKNYCWTGGYHTSKYDKHGKSGECKDGKGAAWTNSVYQLYQKDLNSKWLNLGCYKDSNSRRFPGKQKPVSGSHAIQECYDLAVQQGHPYFGLEYRFLSSKPGCFTGSDRAYITALGAKQGCVDGKGASWRLNVYEVVTATTLQQQ